MAYWDSHHRSKIFIARCEMIEVHFCAQYLLGHIAYMLVMSVGIQCREEVIYSEGRKFLARFERLLGIFAPNPVMSKNQDGMSI